MMDQPEEAAVMKEKAALEDQRTSRITSQSPVPDFHQETHSRLRRRRSMDDVLDFKEEQPSPINTEKIQKVQAGSWIDTLQNRLYRLVLICLLLLLSLVIIWLRYT